MRLVPGATSTSFPSIVSLGIARDQGLELLTEFLDVADVGADRAVVEGADGGAGAALGHVQDRIEVLLAALPVHDPVRHLVDPAGGLAAGRALAARLVRVEARHHHETLRDRDRPSHPPPAP